MDVETVLGVSYACNLQENTLFKYTSCEFYFARLACFWKVNLYLDLIANGAKKFLFEV